METGKRIKVLEEQYGTLTEQIRALMLQNQTILQQLGQLIQQSQTQPTGVPSLMIPPLLFKLPQSWQT
jgi:hypothetical protein